MASVEGGRQVEVVLAETWSVGTLETPEISESAVILSLAGVDGNTQWYALTSPEARDVAEALLQNAAP
jgi:hypothetical protein